MKLKENMSSDKLRGGYYTPLSLSDYVTEWGLKGLKNVNVLEPSCGDGNFVQSIYKHKSSIADFIGIEIVKEEALKANEIVENESNFNIINEDFYKYYEQCDEKFDVILGNPPYIRYQYLTQEQRDEHIQILKSSDMKANKLINAWVSFIVASVNMMKSDSRIGMVIPAELLQVKYAEDLRMFLMKQLQKITIVTFSELVFPKVEQEVVLLLGERDSEHNDEHKIRVINYEDINTLLEDNLDLNGFKDIKFNDSKWTRYLLSSNENSLLDTCFNDSRYIRFNDVADVDIGITTGNNSYFCLNSQMVNEYNLDEFVRPLIARSVSIRGLEFTQDDWSYNIDKGSNAFLLDAPNISYDLLSENLKRYVDLGVENNEHKGYKCSIRNNWHSIPSVWSPDAFFLRRNYKYPKFILNTDINAVSTDTMHRIRFNLTNINPRRFILSYYNSIGLASVELEGRSYGGGVLEVLPGELEKVTLVNIFDEDVISDDEIDRCFEKVDKMIRSLENDDIIEVLNFIDNELLVQKVHFNQEEIDTYRDIWIKLRERRLNRGKKKK